MPEAPNALAPNGTAYHDPTAQPVLETPPGPLSVLTTREREVALLLARGDTNREISTALGISIKTIDTHRGHILKKLELRGNVALTRWAIRNGLVQP